VAGSVCPNVLAGAPDIIWAMYAIVREFLERLGSGDELIEYSTGDNRVAMAVLLFRVIAADGKILDVEVARFREILEDFIGVPPDELALFEQTVRARSEAEKSLFPFTTIVGKMPREKKRQVLGLMRELSTSDNELHEFEINLVARTAELLGLEPDE